MENKKQEKKEEKLTPHFSFKELTRTDEHELQEKNRDKALEFRPKLQKLAEFAEGVRAILNCPMIITSGFRCEELNKKVGGSPTSQHRFAEAIDFIPKTMSAFEAYTRILISGISYGQMILEKRGQGHLIHISLGSKRQKLYSPKGGQYDSIF